MIWRKTKEFESISVSDDGQVRNDITGRIYKPTINKQGYCVITGPDRKQYKIHRLVAMAFQDICGSYCDNMVIDHLNTVRTDNRASNLMWVTIKGNMNNPITKLKLSDSKKGDKNPMKRKEVALKSAESNRGKHLTDEHKIKISSKLKGRKVSIETKMKMSESSKLRSRNNKGQFIYEEV